MLNAVPHSSDEDENGLSLKNWDLTHCTKTLVAPSYLTPEDGSTMFVRNTVIRVEDCIMPQHRRSQ